MKNYATQYLNKVVEIKVDRPLNSYHPKHKDLKYEVNYGYVPDTISGDGEEIDAYLLGINEPVISFKGKCIAIIHRLNDNDDKLVVVPDGMNLTDEEIKEKINFMEQYFKSVIIRE